MSGVLKGGLMVYNYSEVEHYRLHSIKVLKNRIRKDSIRKYKEKYNKKKGFWHNYDAS